MASFDFVDVAAKAYEFMWKERSYIARVAVPVILVKLVCVITVYIFGYQEKFLLSGIIMIPGFVLEAILAIGLIRYVLYREPIFIAGRAVTMPENTAPPARYYGTMSPTQSIQAGFAMYLLIRLFQVAFSAWVQDYGAILESQSINPEPINPTLIHAIIMLCVLWVIIWMIRLGWLFIPIAMGYSFVSFLRRIKGLTSSFYFFAAWFICSLPILVLYGGMMNIVGLVISAETAVYIVLGSLVMVVIEIIMVCLQTVAMTYGIAEMLSDKTPDK